MSTLVAMLWGLAGRLMMLGENGGGGEDGDGDGGEAEMVTVAVMMVVVRSWDGVSGGGMWAKELIQW